MFSRNMNFCIIFRKELNKNRKVIQSYFAVTHFFVKRMQKDRLACIIWKMPFQNTKPINFLTINVRFDPQPLHFSKKEMLALSRAGCERFSFEHHANAG